ncbi:MAG: hypothetical protein LBH87_03665 [Coriobacteriales bacterium]|jgi:hypothetical protein|nr:hypothetical protein [Coriobacteriales bacterium]
MEIRNKQTYRSPFYQALLLGSVGFLCTLSLGILGALGLLNTWYATIPLAILSGVFQVWSAFLFNKNRQVDPAHARASLRRLATTAGRTQALRFAVEEQFERGTANNRRKELGVVSAQLSYIEEDLANSIDDWNEFYREPHESSKEIHYAE